MLGKYTQGSNRFLKSEDLLSGFEGHAVLIQMIKEETAKRFGREQTVCTMAFAEYPDKVLNLNVTNAKMLEELFGADCGPKELIGQVVWIFSERTSYLSEEGKTIETMGIRLRALDHPSNGIQGKQSEAAARAQSGYSPQTEKPVEPKPTLPARVRGGPPPHSAPFPPNSARDRVPTSQPPTEPASYYDQADPGPDGDGFNQAGM